ncbi:MAG: PQQ-binding-like beta-propeller repeat protein [Methanoregulaceae archaeon]|nr:PQQ-binding-like beta-propeller repeat protein [Methanoregulaceae archaeon]
MNKSIICLLVSFCFAAIVCGAVTAAGLADTPQPKFHHDARNSGQSPYTGWQSNTTKWSVLGGMIIESSPAIGSDGTIYVGSEWGDLYARNPDGSKKWTFSTCINNICADIFSSPAIGSDGTIYFGCDNGYFYAVRPDGTLKWRYYAGDWIRSSPAIGSDGTVYFGCDDGFLYALWLNGTKKWRAGTAVPKDYIEAGGIRSSPVLDGTDNIYFGCTNGYFFSLNPSGKRKWVYPMYTPMEGSPAMSGDETTLYFGNTGRYIWSLGADGSLKDYVSIEGYTYSTPAVATGGTVYVGTDDGILHAYLPNLTEKWHFDTGSYIESSPAIGADGTIYFGCSNGMFYALSPLGTEKWNLDTGYPITSSPAIGSDGTIYFGNENGLVAIGAPNGPVPAVTSVTPSSGVRGKTVTITNLSGKNFVGGARVNLTAPGLPNITMTVGVVTPKKITGTIKIPATAQAGYRKVVVTNPDGRSGSKAKAFHVLYPKPVITSVSPATGVHGKLIPALTITGTGFRAGAKAFFTRAGKASVPITVTQIKPTRITGRVTLPAGMTLGLWNVQVKGPDIPPAVKANAFTVT